jgi:hypothetical protein
VLFSDWNRIPINSPRGAWTRLDQLPARPDRASLARNVRFEPGRVKTRCGTAVALAVTAKVNAMFQWKTSALNFSNLNRLLYLVGGTIVRMWDFVYEQSNDMITSILAKTAVIAEAGSNLFVAFFNAPGDAPYAVRVVYPLFTSGTNKSDVAFGAPPSITPALTDTAAGLCTGGTHLVSFIMETRSGFSGPPGPEATITLSADDRTIQVVLNGTWPADAAYIHLIMTTSENAYRWYFVPGGTGAVTPGVFSVTRTISISDEDLAAFATVADEHENYITGNILASSVVAVGRRLAYFRNTKVYVSEIDDFQAITEDQHVLYLPGQKQVVTGFQKRGVFYVAGPAWTYAFSDNEDLPVTWATPELVSGALGIPGPHCVEPRTGGEHAWIANTVGLFLFDSQFSDIPISYFAQAEWNRINWAAPYAVFVRDDIINQRLKVAAPLDGATTPTHILTFDYSRGKTPETVDFSLDDFSAGSFGCIEIVQDETTAKPELWIGPAAVGSILKESATATDDNGVAIDSIWRSGLLMGTKKPTESRFGGADLDVRGSGTLKTSLIAKGGDLTEDGEDVALESTPEANAEISFDLVHENAQLQLGVNAVGHWFDLSSSGVFQKPYLP